MKFKLSLKQILCKLKIHFSGICCNGQFICPDCGLVLDTFHKYCDNCKFWQEACYGISDGNAENCKGYSEKLYANRITPYRKQLVIYLGGESEIKK